MATYRTEELVEQLATTWSSVESVCRSLDDEQWGWPTGCPGWDVHDQVAHIIGTESMLAGRPTPEHPADYPDHAGNDIARFNEDWIAELRPLPPVALLDHLHQLADERLAHLRSLDDAGWAAEGPTPIGTAPYRRFMEIRVFDCWAHEQDIRVAVGQPGHATGPAADRSVDEVVGALGFLMGKKAALAEGTTVRFVVGERVVDVAVEGRARVLAALDEEPQATVTTDRVTFVRLASGRLSGAEAIGQGLLTIAGDPGLGERVAGSLTFTM